MPEKIQKNLQDVEDNKLPAALSYIWALCLYGLLFKQKSPFVQFHAKQGVALFVLELAAPLFGPFAFFIWLLAFILVIKGVKASWEGKYWVMPIIGEWIRKRGL